MTAEAKLSNISPEQIFRDGHTWVTEELLIQNGLFVELEEYGRLLGKIESAHREESH